MGQPQKKQRLAPQHGVTSLQLLLHRVTHRAGTGLAQGWHRQEGTRCGPEQVSDNPRGAAASKRRNEVSTPPQDDQALEEPKKISWAALKMLALRGKFQKFKGDKPPAFTFLWIFSILADKALGEPGEQLQHQVLVWSQ